MINLPTSKIGDLEINLIQGPMGVGISGRNLSSAVANCGGAGMIAAVGLAGVRTPEKLKSKKRDYVRINQEALREEIRGARKMLSPDATGVIGVNVMFALSDFRPLLEIVAEEEVKLLTVGAGFDPELMGFVSPKTKVGIVISYGRFARNVCEIYEKAGRLPDFFVGEGPKAGGHLGFGRRKLEDTNFVEGSLEQEIQRAKKEVEQFGDIPVFAGGGISNGYDIRKAHSFGADGVQIATAFIPTKECDASREFKMTHLNATEKDVVLINSPVGMVGRAINNDFLKRVAAGEKVPFKCPYRCLTKCNPKTSPYCIAEALLAAQRGDFENGFAFTGLNVGSSTPEKYLDAKGDFINVRTLMERFSREYHEGD
jgi:nitronate monooxygenase